VRFRLSAFGLHLAGSASALSVVLGGFWLGWYRWPGWYLAAVLHVVGILVMVDLVLGPTLTLVVANPAKPRRELTRDISIIVAVQLAALVYGAVTLWLGRPLYYTFSVDRLELVQASDLKRDDITAARRENPRLAPYWYSRPRWIWAPLPDDPEEAQKIVGGSLFGGTDVIQMPRLFRPWADSLTALRRQLRNVDQIKYLTSADRARLKSRLAQRGLDPEKTDAIVMWGGTRRVLVVFDLVSMQIRAILRAD
jgi:hypothetical protein